MRPLLLAWLFAMNAFGQTAVFFGQNVTSGGGPPGTVCPSGYVHWVPLVVQASQVSGTQTNFPNFGCFNKTLANGNACPTLTDLKTVGNGGTVQHTVSSTQVYTHTIPADFVLTAGTTTVIPFEVDYYVASSGEIEFTWQGTVNGSTNTTFYACFDSAAITADQSSPNSVWDSDFKIRLSLADAGSPNDSTSNGHNATPTSVTASGNAQTGPGLSFNGSSSLVDVASTGSSNLCSGNILNHVTISAWVVPTTANQVAYSQIAGQNYSNPSVFPYNAYGLSAAVNASSGPSRFGGTQDSGGNFSAFDPGSNVTTSPTFVAFVYNNGSTSTLYINGASAGTFSPSGSLVCVASGDFSIGNTFTGIISNVQASDLDRGTPFIVTQYNNVSNPATYAVMGTEH